MRNEQSLRAFLTPDEVTSLLRAAKKGRHDARNHAMILIAYRHGLRASEVTGLRVWVANCQSGGNWCLEQTAAMLPPGVTTKRGRSR
jgi:type 1 fimbriae regulatory protein FimB